MKELLIKALKEAGKIQREYFDKVHDIKQKESISSIITEVDIFCDRIISEAILKQFPSHNILSEESGFTSNDSKYTWVIDPLDGTSNFAAGLPWFGVLIALFEKNKPVLAAAYLPLFEKLFVAESGKGAFLNNKKLEIKNSELKKVLFSFSMDYTEDKNLLEEGLNYYRFLIQNTRNIRSTNSLFDLMMVAEGKLGGAVNMFTRIWDIAAPWLIIREAGGDLKHLNFKEVDFDLGKNASEKNYPVIAGSFSILNEIKEKQKS